jgi:hypothetical protein
MEPRLEKLARLGVEPDALAVLEQYGKTLPRDIKALDEKALAEMKLKASQLGKYLGKQVEEKIAKDKADKEAKAPKTAKAASAKAEK